ncbi:MAG: YggS family pyridoxal phosphate-dependent enzyme [Planctomycetes bacterium]|nr:YggS family pyridoxal phosphate-dependent enzyme [Planctomycetota bacterium]
MQEIADRLKRVEDNIASACERASRAVEDITMIVVTKTASIESIKEVIRQGYTHLGENRLQHLKQVAKEVAEFLEAGADDPSLVDSVDWHMIGHLQRNKVRSVLKTTSFVHSVDTLRLAEEISETGEKLNITPNVLLQVNCSEEPQKYGVPVGAAIHLAEQITTMNNIRLVGLMTMAPLTLNKDIVRSCFVRGREIFEEIKDEGHVDKEFKHLSMGMSQDYKIAIEEGATILRIGSAIFTDNKITRRI